MLVPIANDPRDYAWGSTTLLAELEGREPSGRPEAEVWFGDHPGSPARVVGGRSLDEWLAEEGRAAGAPTRLPYLLKLLAAASALSIQAHPTIAQAQDGFAREEEAGIPVDAAHRTYRDLNHKPELIVAVSDEFVAMAGLRDVAATRRLLGALGEAAAALEAVLAASDPADGLRAALTWTLAGATPDDLGALLGAVQSARSEEFAAELANARQLIADHPGDAGVVVALLMNLVTLRRGEGLFVDAGVLHAYVRGLGVEIMAASDNVLRGGLTPKHIDVDELLAIVDTTPGPARVVRPRPDGAGIGRYDVPVADFALTTVEVRGSAVEVALSGTALVVATEGDVTVAGGSGDAVPLRPGRAVLVAPDEPAVVLHGTGRVFLAEPGR
ncbi:mannose-6-phosphate isomerase, class I [Microbacterium sp. ET2]|uniref:mannose-6-phosphate isomerase, class I n=1 Tax=Microbacterium albipurpureum TaxID=3050384 RepID=UPI00259C89F3|nr:mannose-6-phosphate isomerase, class I [Microbacterium sp. ET2 (Ac-2212)]WJL95115.1 mannose-6-phosphate isomerase, class I [Microbacterium sp. ET2 (Ac-2212)]